MITVKFVLGLLVTCTVLAIGVTYVIFHVMGIPW